MQPGPLNPLPVGRTSAGVRNPPRPGSSLGIPPETPSPKVQIEEDVPAEPEVSRPRPKCLGEPVDGSELEGRQAASDQDRCHREMEPVERPRLQEPGDRPSPPLDEDAAEAEPPEAREDHPGVDPPRIRRREEELRIPGSFPLPGAPGERPDADRPRGTVSEHPVPRVQPSRRIQDDADRTVSGNLPDRELRIIGRDGASPNHDGVHERPEPVEAPDVLGTRDVVRVPGHGSDPTVEALADLRNREAALQLERDEDGEDATCGLGRCTDNIPCAGRVYLKPHVRVGIMAHPARLPTPKRSGPQLADEIPRDVLIDACRQ